jgi:PTS system nitrogen regulatory IIA component
MIAGLYVPSWLQDRSARGRLPAGLLVPQHIAFGVDATSREQVFATVAALVQGHRGPSPAEVVDRLTRREARSSTALGRGFALPHAHVSSLRAPVAMVLRLARAIPFAAPDGQHVSDLLVLLVPRPATAAHLELLSRLTRTLTDRHFCDALRRCDDAQGVCTLFLEPPIG